MDRKLFFGEYLIARGLVTEQDVLEALAEQKRLIQSFEKMALEYGFLSMKQVFSILTRQAASDLSFEQIALRDNYLDQEQSHLIQTSIQKQRRGVGDILVDQGKLTASAMQAHLKQFHDEIEGFDRIEALLKRIDLFKHLDAAALRTLGSIAICQEHDPGYALVREGEHADSLFTVVSGQLRVTKNNPNGTDEPIHLCNLGPNEFFGEACLFGNARRSANVITESRVLLIAFKRGDFVRFLRDHPIGSQSLFIHMIDGLLNKLESTSLELSQERSERSNVAIVAETTG
jgi:CRP-like cAMP-binding protein